jgi:hypothetical protein
MLIVKVFTVKRLATLALAMLLVSPALAQDSTKAAVTVRSNPSGATVILSGDFTVAGITPTVFTQGLLGYYEITAYRPGYETYHSSIILSGSQPADIQVSLEAKTRAKAALRSLIIPGWGQRYYGSKTKGGLLTIGAVAGGITAGLFQLHFVHTRDDYFNVLDRYNATRSVDEREAMLGQLYDAQKKAYDAEQDRNVAGAIVAGFWIYNVLDALLFFPDYGIQISGANLSVAPAATPNGLALTGKLEF